MMYPVMHNISDPDGLTASQQTGDIQIVKTEPTDFEETLNDVEEDVNFNPHDLNLEIKEECLDIPITMSEIDMELAEDNQKFDLLMIKSETVCDADGNDQAFSCEQEYCYECFSNAEDLVNHKKKHHNLCMCKFCHDWFPNSSALYKHMRNSCIQCDQCGKSFDRLRKLKRHMISHSSDDKKRYYCPICRKEYKKCKDMLVHKESHNEVKTECNECGRLIHGPRNMKIHLRNHIKKFECDVCQKTFPRIHTLTMHKRVHTGERPFICYTCGRSFIAKGNLVIHLRIHSNDRPFVCKICNKGYTNSSQFIRHKKAHVRPSKIILTSEMCGEKDECFEEYFLVSTV